ncbi:MAG: peptidoglycan-binding protein [Clostridiaceae bacterium BRH_c20a]|nr:MAG: peptidoglycan-binding protein [Clostridiaceae bacterium BRH_c20a]
MSAIPCPSGRLWKVRRGDTLYKIAIISGTSVQKILELNPSINPQNLPIGSFVCLPPEKPCASGIFWRVAPGDTLFQIALATNTTVEKLRELNPDLDPLNLQVGFAICLPG